MIHDDWEHLTQEQRDALQTFRERVGDVVAGLRAEFEREHPEMYISGGVTFYPYLIALKKPVQEL